MDWKKLFKNREDIKKAARKSLDQKEPYVREKKEESEMQRRIREANENKKAQEADTKASYKRSALKKLSKSK